jgi:hypothetical protein
MRVVAWSAAMIAGAPLPVPIGVGPRYQPRPALHGPCRVAPLHAGKRVHLELFANRRVVIVPAGLGVRGRCRADTWTTEPTGVVRFDRTATLGDLFAVWGRPLAAKRLLSFRGAVSMYRNGVRLHGDVRQIRLRDHDELVLEIRGYVPPHRSFVFPPH